MSKIRTTWWTNEGDTVVSLDNPIPARIYKRYSDYRVKKSSKHGYTNSKLRRQVKRQAWRELIKEICE